MFQHILLPTDGSQLSRDTAARAVSFAKAANARITAMYAKPIGQHRAENYTDFESPSVVDRLLSGSDSKAKEYLGFIKKLCKDAGVECTTLAVAGDAPWEAIIDVAEDHDCDLIFMSKHGRGEFSSLLLGSETYRVLTHSSIPVLVYRPPELGMRRRGTREKAKDKDKDKKKA
ncbi:MAG: universal stress protein [Candidatus Accumulibacter sp.]|uniref:universal stress protein n=1 Tax=Accumulibacter sp. TaxID=2053492 RepID=UPI001D6F6698|nr:universal stress protein [Accumulibacter sp.]MCB1943377.1 universal stress protein [Accumulibacter sp.]MCP5248998.1 universal stress protein [Accumulibacter sp.]